MATAYRKGPSIYVGFKDGTGTWVKQKTHCQTITEARKLASELEQAAERRREALQPARMKRCAKTLSELCTWWLDNHCGEPSRDMEQRRLRKHIQQQPIGALKIHEVTPAKLTQRLKEMSAQGAAPASVNKLRGTLLSIYAAAEQPPDKTLPVWNGGNHAADTETLDVPDRPPTVLRADQVAKVFTEIPEQWKPLFAAALYSGLRKGELFALRIGDVNLEHGTLHVCRSWGRDTTKGGHSDYIPIAESLIPWLQQAVGDRGPEELVFPGRDGKMMERDSKPQKILRSALVRAGIVDRWVHKCRRKGCGYREEQKDDAERRCPKCQMILWPVAVKSKMRLHDMRHTGATLMIRAKVNPVVVQKILRHKDLETTLNTYTHLMVEDLRAGLDKLPVIPAPEAKLDRELPPHGTRLVPVPRSSGIVAEGVPEVAGFEREKWWALGDSNPRPLPCENSPGAVTKDSQGSDPLTRSRNPSRSDRRDHLLNSQRFAAIAAVRRNSGTRLVPEKIGAELPPIMSLGEAARALSLSTATLYKLCRRGGLRSFRIFNAVRISRSDLVEFLAAHQDDAHG